MRQQTKKKKNKYDFRKRLRQRHRAYSQTTEAKRKRKKKEKTEKTDELNKNNIFHSYIAVNRYVFVYLCVYLYSHTP